MIKIGLFLYMYFILMASAITAAPQNNQNIYKTAYQKAIKSVVGIKAFQVGSPLLGKAYAPIMGSGVILDKEGHIATNKHVVERIRDLKVTLYNDEEYPASLVKASDDIDLAIIKITNAPPDLQAIILFENSDNLEPGEVVLAIGNPAGLSKTLTHGIISAVGRYIPGQDRPTPHTFIQTDTAINPGNSGGALVNLEGELVGIPTLTLSNRQGISFAIPVNVLRAVLPQLLSSSNERGWLGISTQELTSDLREATAIPNNIKGLMVTSLHPLSPAKKKLEPLDIIVKINHSATIQKSDLEWMIRNSPPGTKVLFSIFRAKSKTNLEISLQTTTVPTP